MGQELVQCLMERQGNPVRGFDLLAVQVCRARLTGLTGGGIGLRTSRSTNTVEGNRGLSGARRVLTGERWGSLLIVYGLQWVLP